MSRRPQEREPHRRAPARRRWAQRGRLLAGPLSVAGHALVLLALLSAHVDPPTVPEPVPMTVALVAPPPPPPAPPAPAKVEAPPAPTPPTPAKSSPAKSSKAKSRPRPKLRQPRLPPPPDVESLAVSETPTPELADGLGEAELAGATIAGSGSGSGSGAGFGSGSGGGGACDMVRLLQDALRKNPRLQAAVIRAHPGAVAAGKAVMLWNGDWVKSPGQEGKGLAGLREAIILEVAFAPKACRTDPVRGLVVISLNDSPGSVRLALGSDQWRWSDLLFAR